MQLCNGQYCHCPAFHVAFKITISDNSVDYLPAKPFHTMMPQISSWENLLLMSEDVDEDIGKLQYTVSVTVEDGVTYYGQFKRTKGGRTSPFKMPLTPLPEIRDKDILAS